MKRRARVVRNTVRVRHERRMREVLEYFLLLGAGAGGSYELDEQRFRLMMGL